MTTPTLSRERDNATPSTDLQVTSLDEVAETIREEALAMARERLGLPQRRLDLASLFRRPEAFDYFKYGLTCGVSQVLAANDKQVRAIYTYDPAPDPDGALGEERPPEATLHLLVLVTRPSAALQAFVAALDRALTASLRDLPSQTFAACESVLDVNLITEKDARLGVGPAALLSSVFAPPLKVWQREA